jgi:hypothetical protein
VATTLAQIMSDAKDVADMVSNPIVGDTTWRRWINQGQERLYRLLVVKAPARFHSSVSFTLVGGVGGNTQALAADFRHLRDRGVTKNPTNAAMRQTLDRFAFGERDAQGHFPVFRAWDRLGFDIQASNIIIEPAALCAGSYAYYYVAGPVAWATDGSGDAVAISTVLEPYVDYIAHWAAIKGLMKEESTETAQAITAHLMDLRDEILAEFGESSDPTSIVDVDRTGGTYWP